MGREVIGYRKFSFVAFTDIDLVVFLSRIQTVIISSGTFQARVYFTSVEKQSRLAEATVSVFSRGFGGRESALKVYRLS